jgi:hypothetical protein
MDKTFIFRVGADQAGAGQVVNGSWAKNVKVSRYNARYLAGTCP